jgi:hypothetical protein
MDNLKYMHTPIGIKPWLNISQDAFGLVGGEENMWKIIDSGVAEKWNNVISTSLYSAIKEVFGYNKDIILGRNRSKQIKSARMIIVFLYYQYGISSLEESSRRFGLHHSTVLYYNDKLIDICLIKFDPEMARLLKEVRLVFIDKIEKHTNADEFLKEYENKMHAMISRYRFLKKNKDKAFLDIVEKMQ